MPLTEKELEVIQEQAEALARAQRDLPQKEREEANAQLHKEFQRVRNRGTEAFEDRLIRRTTVR